METSVEKNCLRQKTPIDGPFEQKNSFEVKRSAHIGKGVKKDEVESNANLNAKLING